VNYSSTVADGRIRVDVEALEKKEAEVKREGGK
jgi:hypothetical protein